MGKKKWRTLTVGGAIAAVLSGVFIVYGIFDAIQRSQYQDIGMNTPAVVIAALIFIAGAAACYRFEKDEAGEIEKNEISSAFPKRRPYGRNS